MNRNHSNAHVVPLANPSRRGFLAASTVTLGAAALGRPLVLLGATAASTAANNRVNLALVGCGGQGRGDMRGMLSCGANLVALCDPDPAQIEMARADALNSGGAATKDAKAYDDYRKLLNKAASFDAVLIGTPDHWHAPLCKAFMKIGKHIYCEKPLTHSVAEARELRELARGSKVVTQMGNQGSASASLRRCTEIIRAGALGQIREIYHWGIGVNANEGSARAKIPSRQALTGTCGSDRRPCVPLRKTRIIPSVGAGGSISVMAALRTSAATPLTCRCGPGPGLP